MNAKEAFDRLAKKLLPEHKKIINFCKYDTPNMYSFCMVDIDDKPITRGKTTFYPGLINWYRYDSQTDTIESLSTLPDDVEEESKRLTTVLFDEIDGIDNFNSQ